MSNIKLLPPVMDIENALEVIDRLRADVAAGRFKFFTAVALESDHGTRCYQAALTKTSRLEAYGAVTHLLHCHLHGELDDDQS